MFPDLNFCRKPHGVAIFLGLVLLASGAEKGLSAPPDSLRIGVAQHAFDHLGNIGEQAEASAASGVSIIYATGLGGLGYSGLPPEKELLAARQAALEYTTKAKSKGIPLALGYVCATSIVGLNSFDKNWTAEFLKQFVSPPGEWRQQDKNGKPLVSWYGGEYQPACMNNPDWRTYEKAIVRMQLETGHDGIFFDNPTVHPQGCYCRFCMEKYGEFFDEQKGKGRAQQRSLDELRKLAVEHPREFMQFRCTIARDFLAEIRKFARSIKRGALITCNNSLNSTEAFYLQCRTHAYNIFEMSKAEDLVVVEDQSSQPRMLNGRTIEYGAMYKQLHAISHGKPVVAVTIADGDYHTAPNLVRLVMAEAAANEASYLMWPTWPENQRQRMSTTIRPQADLQRENEKLLNNTEPRTDVLLFLPFRRWLETDKCAVTDLAAELTRKNVQYAICSEEDLEKRLISRSSKASVFLVESGSVLNDIEMKIVEKFEAHGGKLVCADTKNWLANLQLGLEEPSLRITGPATIRGVVRDQSNRTLLHLYNLNVEKVSSFEDKVHAAENVQIEVLVPFEHVKSVRALTADPNGTAGELKFVAQPPGWKGSLVKVTIPRLEIATILCIEK